jgi:hypothetical protein
MEPRQTAGAGESTRVSRLFLGRFTRIFAAVTLLLALVLPPQGHGVPLCYFRNLFQLPCPGCGLTRSFTNVAHLRFADAFHYHPFGLVLFPLMLAVVVVSLLPRARRETVAAWLDHREKSVRRTYHVAVMAFLLFGVVRLAAAGFANGWLIPSG